MSHQKPNSSRIVHHKHKGQHLKESQFVVVHSTQAPPQEEPIQQQRQIKHYPEPLVFLQHLYFLKGRVLPVMLQNVIELGDETIGDEQDGPG